MSAKETGNKVLLIEDNPGDARLVEILLKESDLADCGVEKCESLEEGFEALSRTDNFTAILLDLSLPDSHGFETLEKLLAKFPHNNVIVLTGYSDKQLGVKAVQAGAQDFLVKGMFDSDQLGKSLRFSIERNAILSRLEETQRIAHIGNWEYNMETARFDASDEVYRIFSLPVRKTSEPGKMDDKFLSSFFGKIHELTLQEGTVKKDFPLQWPNGTQRHVFIQCKIDDTSESMLFHGVIQDITERKIAEQESIKSRERYQEIFSQSKDAIYLCTLHGKLIDCNKATEELFQVARDKLFMEEDFHELFVPAEKKNEFLLKLRYQRSVSDFEIEIERENGERRFCLITANIQAGDHFSGYHAIVRDITERKQTEALIKARDLARQSAKMKEQFIANVSHEMRTPMNAIYGMNNLLGQTELDSEQRELVKSINQSAEILLGIINDVLDMASIQYGKIVFENKEFDLYDLMFNLVNVMQFKAKEKDLFIQVEIENTVPNKLIGDHLRLNQIFYNLMGNAIKFSDEGYVKVYVELLNEFEGGVHLRFSVQDTGIGIPEEKLEAIFESFTRIRQKDRLYEGTGLGLSITKSLVEQQGGKINATSTPGKGSVFSFDLIFETAPEEKPLLQEAEIMDLDPDRQYRLLLVEDHKMNQLVARKTLEKKWTNVAITIAENGKEAVELLEKKLFDIILMDVQMPVMDGYEATRHIRQMPPSIAAIPVLAITAHGHVSKDERFRESGMDDFVLKPFQPEQLFNKIIYWLKNGRLQEVAG